MRLDKAAEIISIHQELLRNAKEPDLRDALKLGIQALLLLAKYREGIPDIKWQLLPGETAEADSP